MPTFTRLERAGIFLAVLVLILTVVTSTGLLPRRSFASMVAGLVMLLSSGAELLLLFWLVGQHVWAGKVLSRSAWTTMLFAATGAMPAIVVGVRMVIH